MIARRVVLAVCMVLVSVHARAATLTPEARAAYERYLARVEAQLDQRHESTQRFIVIDDKNADFKLRQGKLLVRRFKADVETPGAMIHHWSATMLVPGGTAQDFLRVTTDYARYPEFYRQEITRAKVLEQNGNVSKVLMRMTQHRVVTVVLDGDFVNTITQVDAAHGYTTSKSTEILEIADAGKHSEHVVPRGRERGFLWSLNLYWSYEERPEGLLVQCETVSLTRDIPWGWAWLVKPLIQSIPRDALTYTLTQTRNEMLKKQPIGHEAPAAVQ